LSLALLSAFSFAAEAPVTPGSVQSEFDAGKPRLPATPPQVLLPQPAAPSPHNPRARRFQVRGFVFSGNTVFSSRTLKTLVERYQDMELNLYDLNQAADVVSEFYHEHGYTLARAVIPSQKVVDGAVQIRIIEGRIGKVGYSGNKRFSTSFLSARTKQLKPGALVTTDNLEHDLLLLNDIPGLSAKVVLEPGAEFGATDADIKIAEKLFSGSVGVSNYGRKETGQNKLDTAISLNSPFGLGDQLTLAASDTQHKLVRYWKAGYSFPLNTLGTRLTIDSSKAAYDVSGAVAALGISGDIRSSDIMITHPFARSRADSRWLTVGVKRSRLKQSALGVPVSDNAINVLNVNYLINHIHDDTSVTNASFSLDTNGRSVNSDPTRQDAVFARMEADVNYTTPFVGKWDLYLRGDVVHSKEMLPDTEKFSLGGPGSIRAFRPSEVRGDRGYQATAELRYPFALAERMGSFRLTTDIGEVIYKAPGFNDSRDRLRSAGFGASFYPFAGATLSVDVARQIGPSGASNDGAKSRVWVNFSANF
jgi:hemolysin activation/secretion protein